MTDYPLAVLAGSYEQYHNYLTKCGIKTEDAIYIKGPGDIHGRRFRAVVAIGTCYQIPDFLKLLSLAKENLYRHGEVSQDQNSMEA